MWRRIIHSACLNNELQTNISLLRSCVQSSNFISCRSALNVLPIVQNAPSLRVRHYNDFQYNTKSLNKRNLSDSIKNVIGRNQRLSAPNILRGLNHSLERDTEVSTLRNGIRVVSQYCQSPMATVGLWIDAGSRYETELTNGAAHFLEHLTTKGTSRRSKERIELDIENSGGHLNAYTSREHTVYYMKVFNNDMFKGLDLLSDILQRSLLSRDAIEIERGVILREKMEVEKNIEEIVFDNLHKAAFSSSSLGFTILGSEKNIQSLQREDLADYIQSNYYGNRIVVVGVGEVLHKDLEKMASDLLSDIPRQAPKASNSRALADVRPEAAVCLQRVSDDRYKGLEVAVGWSGAKWTSPDTIGLMLVQSLLGSYSRQLLSHIPLSDNTNSFIRLLSEKGLLNKIRSYSGFTTCYSNTGLFGTYLSLDDGDSIDLTMQFIKCLKNEYIDKIQNDDVTTAQFNLMSNIVASLDSTTSIADDIGRHILVYGRRISLKELFYRLSAYSCDDLKHLMKKYLNSKSMTMSIVGDVTQNEDSIYEMYRQC